MSATHLVTGATGFVGAAIVLELLSRTNDSILALVRPGAATAESRFQHAIEHAARAYGSTLDFEAALSRCHVVAGDLVAHECGVMEANAGRIAQVWHCAASLRYEDRFEAEIRSSNVDGTRRMLELATRLGAETFNYVSTAYVAGRTTGVIREQAMTGVEVNNRYERSKLDAEELVLASNGPHVRIFRPSVVVGHSRTLQATTFSGLYGFLRQLLQFRGMVNRMQAGLLDRMPVRLRIDPDALINLVPIDSVAHEAVTIGLMHDAQGVYHLTNGTPPTTGMATRAVFDLLDLPAPIFVREASELGWLDAKLDERMNFYRSYITADRRFDRSRSDAALGDERSLDIEYDTADIQALGRWYLAQLQHERAKLPVAR